MLDIKEEPVWKEDVEAQLDELGALWKTQYGFVQRLKFQEAPESLIAKMVAVNNLLHQAHQVLEESVVYFPEEPRNDERS
jgi:hypothetical protein